MPNPIKAFFDKKKADVKFKRAGPGQKLGDTQAAQASSEQRRAAINAQNQQRAQQQQLPRGGGSGSGSGSAGGAASSQAAQAALARFGSGGASGVGGGQAAGDDFEKKRSQAVIRARVQKELEDQKKVDEEINKLKETYGEKPLVEVEAPSACPGVFFHCPLLGPEVLPKEEMRAKIKDFLYAQLEEEKGLTACLMIHTFAKDAEKGKVCIETLCKYLDNILGSPGEEKFRKIRKSNKAFQDRVAACEGHELFLEAAGFESQQIDDQDFWILTGELLEEQQEVLRTLREALVNSEPIRAELDRGMRVLLPGQADAKFSLPSDFFSLKAEEIRREQQAKAELVEREGMLRTKAMREREEQRERRRYKYSLIRIRFPDGLVLQGTFSVYERYRAVHDFVSECLETPLPFVLYEAGCGGSGGRLEMSEYDTSLSELSLAPSALLTFAWHPEVADEVAAQLGAGAAFLKADVRALASDK